MSARPVRHNTIPRRVALVMPTLNRGGAETQALELAIRLPERGWEPIFVTLDPQGDLWSDVRAHGFHVHTTNTRANLPKSSPAFYADMARSVRAMAGIFRRENVDAVQSLLFWSNPIAVPAARLAGVRAVVTNRLQLGTFRDDRPWYTTIENWLNGMVHAVVPNALAIRRDTLDRERISPRRVVVIYNGVDLRRFGTTAPEDFAARHPELADADPLAVVVGNLKPIKRHDVFLRAMAHARERAPRLKAVLVGANHGEQPRLEELARELGLVGAVAFAGPRRDPAACYAAAQIAALTSDGEGLPNALLEAMASRCAIVATRVGGVPELVRHGQSGLLADAGDWKMLGRHLAQLALDPKLRGEMAARGHARAHSRLFHPDTLADAHVQLWESILQTGLPPRGLKGGPVLVGGETA